MRYGLNLVPVQPHELVDAGRRAEQAGFESLWIGEHVIVPFELRSRYAGGTGKPPFRPDSRFVEPFTALAHLAAVTTTIRLGTGVVIVPLHSPFHLARAVATADVLSGGRLLLGVGVGWMEDEYRIVGQGWEDRGARMDEALVVLDALWNEPAPALDGRFFSFPNVGFEPKPVQRPHPPLLVGGASPAALRRTARVGDGWYGGNQHPDEVATVADELTRLRKEYGRDHLPFEITVTTGWGDGFDAELEQAYAAAGVDRIVTTPWARSSEALAAIDAFADAARLRGG